MRDFRAELPDRADQFPPVEDDQCVGIWRSAGLWGFCFADHLHLTTQFLNWIRTTQLLNSKAIPFLKKPTQIEGEVAFTQWLLDQLVIK